MAPRARHRNPPATAGEFYSIATDAVDQAEGAPKRERAKLMREAKAVFKEARRLFPQARIPSALLQFVPFTTAAVRSEMARELDVVASDLECVVTELWDVTVIEVGWGSGRTEAEYVVARNDEDSHAIAIASVTNDLKESPEYFNREFLEDHIDQEALKELVRSMVMEDDYVDDLAANQPEDFWQMAQQHMPHYPLPEPNEDDEMPEKVAQKYIDALRERLANDAADDPMRYLQDFVNAEDMQAFLDRNGIGIDIESAAEQAVRDDGEGHFLSSYDGNVNETKVLRYQYWRVN